MSPQDRNKSNELLSDMNFDLILLLRTSDGAFRFSN